MNVFFKKNKNVEFCIKELVFSKDFILFWLFINLMV